MTPCDKCRFAATADREVWPMECHHDLPKADPSEYMLGKWPRIHPNDVPLGCGVGKPEEADPSLDEPLIG